MKKTIIFIFSIVILEGCSVDDNSNGILQDLAPITSVNIPQSFVPSKSYEIGINYRRPSSCHYFAGLDISQKNNEVTIGVVNHSKTSSSNCSNNGDLSKTTSLNFVVERNDFYIFRFWKGENSVGEDEFIIKQIPITQPDND
jgi:hypothetical protein